VSARTTPAGPSGGWISPKDTLLGYGIPTAFKQGVNANEAEVTWESKKIVQKAKADLNTTKKEPGAAGSGHRRPKTRDQTVRQEATGKDWFCFASLVMSAVIAENWLAYDPC